MANLFTIRPEPSKSPLWMFAVIVVLLVGIAGGLFLFMRDDALPDEGVDRAQPILLFPDMELFARPIIGSDFFANSDLVTAAYISGASLADTVAEGVDSFGVACAGFVADRPAFVINVNDRPASALTFFFQSTSTDVTMLMLDAEGKTHCNDNVQGQNPGIYVPELKSGQYYIWIGTLEAEANISGTLFITSDCRNFFDC